MAVLDWSTYSEYAVRSHAFLHSIVRIVLGVLVLVLPVQYVVLWSTTRRTCTVLSSEYLYSISSTPSTLYSGVRSTVTVIMYWSTEVCDSNCMIHILYDV